MNKMYFTVGVSKIRVTPRGMWMHKVWQNAQVYICSGVKRRQEGGYEYRFTAIGDNSILLPEEDSYNDCFIKDEWLVKPRVDDNCETSEIYLPFGWVKFLSNRNKRQLKMIIEESK